MDEAQYIKNPKTAAAKAVKTIKVKHRFALTGTPIENRLSELWSIFDYLISERLKKMVALFILRRLKNDVLKDLPDKIEEIRYGVMDTEQLKMLLCISLL